MEQTWDCAWDSIRTLNIPPTRAQIFWINTNWKKKSGEIENFEAN